MAPVEISGNWFVKDGKRFLIKGVDYNPRKPGISRFSDESYIDPLSDDWLPELKKDVPYFVELGINAIFVSHTELHSKPDKALKILHDNGIHVLLLIFTAFGKLQHPSAIGDTFEGANLQELYSANLVRDTLTIIDQTADFDNVLGFSVDFDFSDPKDDPKGASRLSLVHRAMIRDAKRFLALRGGRKVPVGVSFPADVRIRKPGLEFMTAGDPAERIDFFAFANYSWYGAHSSLRISGWERQVEVYGKIPVPMLFSAYGTTKDEPRALTEVECLFSSDMTGVFSGGFLKYYGCTPIEPTSNPELDQGSKGDLGDVHSKQSDDASSAEDSKEKSDVGGYELMRVEADGSRRPKVAFWTYKEKLEQVANRSGEEVLGRHEKKNYENWRGGPPERSNFWVADPAPTPESPLDWDALMGSRVR